MHRSRLIVADDHAMFREGVVRLLPEEVEVVATVSTGRALIEEARRLKPDLILADLTMPEMGGLEALRVLKPKAWGRFIILGARGSGHRGGSRGSWHASSRGGGWCRRYAGIAGRTPSPLVAVEWWMLARESDPSTPPPSARILRLLADGAVRSCGGSGALVRR
jgi:hypothetical protein